MACLTRPWSRAIATGVLLAATLGSTALSSGSTGAAALNQGAYYGQISSLRASRGVAQLAVNGQLAGVAGSWASHMAASGALSHNPNLGSEVPPGWTIIAENVGMGPSDSSIESSFAGSAEHYDNMVDPRVSEVGVGEVASGGYLWVVEDFWGNGRSAPLPPPPPPPPPPVLRPASFGPAPVSAPGTSGVRPYLGPVVHPAPPSTTSTTAGRAAISAAGALAMEDLITVADDVQYFDAWD